MRLPDGYAEFFVREVTRLRPEARGYLFGSRTHDNRRGGDIDILILADPKLTWDEIARIRRDFWDTFGFQKLDLISLGSRERSTFKDLILLDAIPLSTQPCPPA